MPGKASDWDNADFLLDLVVGLYTGAQVSGGLTPPVKSSIEEYIKGRGYTTSFDAISSSQLLNNTEQTAFLLINILITPLLHPFPIIVAMAKRQVMQWDANVHEDILISLFQHIKPSAEDWSNVMGDLQQKGYTFTEGALRNSLPKQTNKQTHKPLPFIKPSINTIVMAPRAAAAAGAGKPTRGWDAASHEDLLLALLEEIKPNKADLTNVAAKMRSKGYSYSYDAINQHVQKLRKNRDTTAIQNSGGSENGTPRKRAPGSKTPAKRTPSKRKATNSASVVDEDEDLEDEKMQLKMETDDMGEELMSPKGAKRTKSEPEDEVTVGEV
ncbi:uncharacterized protein FFUJ_13486 [Fusarium fujikuroi IMI 58289]|uniref:Uncharacterized protein n=1 Tax=Gibberella fujikuroi (strain CBS 195.34 / IMI 58289 / NRRL A-6831) TaxID=1279085 RepID=S0DXM5_GIBF5|nr:uncharacterized protein FFUJ_13486 [Fusarium fujikuroi IMI 58289]CCT67286.1 uncharacterized protein FFUJ_13486 [Fusarium fujikuroi IMI 58289]